MRRFLMRAPTGIRSANYVFSEPVPLSRFLLPTRFEGIYVLLVPDPTWEPWHLQPVFFGEIRADREPAISESERVQCLRVAAGRTVYIAVCPLLQTGGLPRIKQELIDCYGPLVNRDSHGDVAEMARKLEAIESKIHEHETLMKLALASSDGQPKPGGATFASLRTTHGS
jgi:hypothetical protein